MTAVNFHASCVAFGNRAVLIRGPSGAGKSDLALQLIDAQGFGLGEQTMRATLISDDQSMLLRENSKIIVFPPPAIAGKLEIRGIGIVEIPYQPRAELELVIDLKPHAQIERLPEALSLRTEILGLDFPCYAIDPTSSSAAAKIRALIS